MSDTVFRRSRQSDMSRGNIVIIGGAGYVGSHAALSLAEAGYLPVCFDNLSSGNREAVKFGPFERGDMRDGDRLSQVFSQYRPVAVVHCATSKFFAPEASEPLDYYSVIGVGTLTLLEAMRRHAVNNLSLLSSAAIYGEHSALSLVEQAPSQPLNAYGACLNAIENMVADFSQSYDLNWISLRLFGVGGADPENGLGEMHENEYSLIPRAIDAAFGQRDYVPILGSHFPTRDGSSLRDYVHVQDVAQAILLSVEHTLKRDGIGPYNIGTGMDRSVLEIIRIVERISGLKCPIRYEAKRPDEPFALSANSSRAKSELGWSPQQSDIDVIVRSAFVFRKALWASRAQKKEDEASASDGSVFIHHEAITDVVGARDDLDGLLKKLDDFLDR